MHCTKTTYFVQGASNNFATNKNFRPSWMKRTAIGMFQISKVQFFSTASCTVKTNLILLLTNYKYLSGLTSQLFAIDKEGQIYLLEATKYSTIEI